MNIRKKWQLINPLIRTFKEKKKKKSINYEKWQVFYNNEDKEETAIKKVEVKKGIKNDRTL